MKLIKDVRLASFDLDDTLLNKGIISPENKEALMNLHKCGCKIVYNTGRSIPMITSDSLVDCVDYIIGLNGSTIYDYQKKEFIHISPIDINSSIYLSNILNDVSCLRITTLKGTISNPFLAFELKKLQKKHKMDYSLSLLGSIAYIRTLRPKLNPKSVLGKRKDILKVEFSCKSIKDAQKLISQINDNGLHAVITQNTNVECTAKDITKGSSIQWLAQYLDIPMSCSIAFGDSGNDADAFSVVDTSIAVDNATEPIKQIADVITDSCKNNGVANYINSLIE